MQAMGVASESQYVYNPAVQLWRGTQTSERETQSSATYPRRIAFTSAGSPRGHGNHTIQHYIYIISLLNSKLQVSNNV